MATTSKRDKMCPKCGSNIQGQEGYLRNGKPSPHVCDEGKRPVGRPPFPGLEVTPQFLSQLDARAKEFADSPGKLKRWLKQRRLFHALLQDHLSTAPLPGASGAQLNAASSKLFLEMTDGMTEALRGVAEEDE